MTYVKISAHMFVSCALAFVILLLPNLWPEFQSYFSAASSSFLSASKSSPLTMISICFVLGGSIFGLHRLLLPRIEDKIARLLAAADPALDGWVQAMSPRTAYTSIIVLSGLTLFLELVLIRWQGSLFPVFALYKNFTLLACFCGLGIGYASSGRRPILLPVALPLLAATLATLLVLRYTPIPQAQALLFLVPVREEASVFASYTTHDNRSWIFLGLPVYLLLIATFILNVLVMVPFAQFCGRVMSRAPALPAYGGNLLGSLAGVALLFLLSSFWAGPVIWFGVSTAIASWYLMPSGAAMRVGIFASLLCVVVTAWPAEPMVQDIYSPYQLIQKTTKSDGLMEILSAGSFFQRVWDLSPSSANRTRPDLEKVVGYYELPFLTAATLDNVAIVGAGSGNDTAAALRAGAKRVHAVEIDPAIIALGIANHPEHPYSDPRSDVVNDDARTFFRNTRDSFDVIVYSVLDSHILLSHGSNVRLDSFVYTQEGLRDAYLHLKPGGLLSVSFTLPNNLMGEKIYSILSGLAGTGHPNAIFSGGDKMGDTTTFMVRKGAEVKLPLRFMADHDLVETTAKYSKASGAHIDLPTDDWPFFYMNSKMYPVSYVIALMLVLALAFFFVRVLLPDQRWNRSLLPFLFLGSGFMLVETKAITELGLLFGNTWHVIGITIIGVLMMAFAGNVLVSRYALRSMRLPYALMLGLLAAGYAVAVGGGLPLEGLPLKLCMVALLTSPLLFSGIVFSTLLKSADDLPSALAYNLLGAMLGGLLEYNSMEFGFAFLYLLALALYFCAAATTPWKSLKV